MQMSMPRTCPDCSDGKKPDGRLCIICRGSGRVHLVPAQRPVDPEIQKLFNNIVYRPEHEIYG
jgi:hypothetical protein